MDGNKRAHGADCFESMVCTPSSTFKKTCLMLKLKIQLRKSAIGVDYIEFAQL